MRFSQKAPVPGPATVDTDPDEASEQQFHAPKSETLAESTYRWFDGGDQPIPKVGESSKELARGQLAEQPEVRSKLVRLWEWARVRHPS
jgi:hypothetical protein